MEEDNFYDTAAVGVIKLLLLVIIATGPVLLKHYGYVMFGFCSKLVFFSKLECLLWTI